MNLWSAVISGTLDDVREALKTEEANKQYSVERHSNTPVHLAAYNCFPDKLKVLLDSLSREDKIKVLNQPNLFGFTPLMEVVYPMERRGSYEQHHTQDETQKYCQRYELRYQNMPQTMEVLLNNGANPNFLSKGKLYGYAEPRKGQHPVDLIELITMQMDCREDSLEYQMLNKCKEKIQIKQQEILLSYQKYGRDKT